jgi:hypothetical protein
VRFGFQDLAGGERVAFFAAQSFLKGRMGTVSAIDWALRIGAKDEYKRLAALDLLSGDEFQQLPSVWQTAWRLMEESWLPENTVRGDEDLKKHYLKQRIGRGDRSGGLIRELVSLVRPRLIVERLSQLYLAMRKPPRAPRRVFDIFRVDLTSGRIVDPTELGIDEIESRLFLVELFEALDWQLSDSISKLRRISLDESLGLRNLSVNRVYFVVQEDRAADEDEPDEFSRGLAPISKLTFSVLERLFRLDPRIVPAIVNRWQGMDDPLHLRLSASALAIDGLASPGAIELFFSRLESAKFWDLYEFPEIAELRAGVSTPFGGRTANFGTPAVERASHFAPL